MSRHLMPALLCSLLLGCDRTERFDEEEPLDPAPAAFPWSTALSSLPSNDTLRNTTVDTSTAGPWTLRTAQAKGHDLRLAGGPLGGGAIRADMPTTSATAELAAAPARPAPRRSRAASRGVSDASAPAAAPASLRAGSTDDNAQLDAYIAFQEEQLRRFGSDADTLEVGGRREVIVRGAEGRPVPGARVSIVDRESDRIVWSARTMGDGRVPVYPELVVPGVDGGPAGQPGGQGWTVEVEAGEHRVMQHWDAARSSSLDLRLDAPWTAAVGDEAGRTVPVDVCFIIDTTGSMGDEIAQVKATLLQLTETLRQEADGNVDLRYSAVLYRDLGDAYVTKVHPFTADLQGFDTALQGIQAAGGGDGPESLNQGLAVAAGGMEWRENAAKVAFLIADAPPHMDYQEDVSYGRAAAAALAQGIKVHTVAASGLDARGSLVFRQIAQLSRGQFIFIEYGSNAASAAQHGLSGPTGSNNLDAILYGRIRAELDGWGRDLAVLSQR